MQSRSKTLIFTDAILNYIYAGELVTEEEALEREMKYAEQPLVGSYMYFFEFR
jgi:hypothetical protein